jgi:hypothetical protein
MNGNSSSGQMGVMLRNRRKKSYSTRTENALLALIGLDAQQKFFFFSCESADCFPADLLFYSAADERERERRLVREVVLNFQPGGDTDDVKLDRIGTGCDTTTDLFLAPITSPSQNVMATAPNLQSNIRRCYRSPILFFPNRSQPVSVPKQ